MTICQSVALLPQAPSTQVLSTTLALKTSPTAHTLRDGPSRTEPLVKILASAETKPRAAPHRGGRSISSEKHNVEGPGEVAKQVFATGTFDGRTFGRTFGPFGSQVHPPLHQAALTPPLLWLRTKWLLLRSPGQQMRLGIPRGRWALSWIWGNSSTELID